MMSSSQSQSLGEIQRVRVDVEGQLAAKRLKISLENYDEGLGWYSAASLTVPIHQVPLLQQALDAVGSQPLDGPGGTTNLIAFPGLRVLTGA